MKTVSRRIVSLVVALPLLIMASMAAADDDITVMTQNQYLGADLTPLLAASDPVSFNSALVAVLRQIADNDFPRRAEALARQIAAQRPHLVGLQEVWSFQCIDLAPLPPNSRLGCNDPTIAGAFHDHLSETLSALAAQGENYHAVATVRNLDLTNIQVEGLPPGVPFQINHVPALLVARDRDVILARGDVVAGGPVTPAAIPCLRGSVDGCNFGTVLEVETPAGKLAVERGYVAVDAEVGGRAYRFVNTHLEIREPDPGNPASHYFQAAQAAELILTLTKTTPVGRTLILVGDINSSPEDVAVIPAIVPPYQQFLASGFSDAWAGQPSSGYTCCQLAGLDNLTSLLNERIDMVFVHGETFSVAGAMVLGDGLFEKTLPPGRPGWPSDHGSVVMDILF